MVRKRLDERIRTLLRTSADAHERSLLVIVGDYGRDQIPNLHALMMKDGRQSLKSRPKVLWCYKKDLGFSSHKKKRMKKLKRDKARGLTDEGGAADNFELFVGGTDINWCYYRDTHRVLGTTVGLLVLQDFEAITPNLLARTIETVQGGGLVVLLLKTVKSLKQLYAMSMDVHARYRTERGGDLVPRFNERFMLSLAGCKRCLVCDDELNVLPLSRSALKFLQRQEEIADGRMVDDDGEASVVTGKQGREERELDELKRSLLDTPHVGAVVELAKTLDQARAILVFLEACSDRGGGEGGATGGGGGGSSRNKTVALTAARGRGKSASIGLCLAGAVSLGYSTLAVTAPEPENLVSVFDFCLKGLEALKYKEHLDYRVTYDKEKGGRDGIKCIVGIYVYRDHGQSIRYIRPDEPDKFASAEIVAIDEAAAIPLPTVRALMVGGTGGGHSRGGGGGGINGGAAPAPAHDRITFVSSTVNGYEGTGRALSLKLIKELRDAKRKGGAGAGAGVGAGAGADIGGTRSKKGETKVHEQRWAAAAEAARAAAASDRDAAGSTSSLVEIELSTPIRYAQGDAVESWLNKLLCLDCGSEIGSRLGGGVPSPSDCDLYSVDRDALFSYHKLSEAFLQKLMGLYTSAHYKNSPNDLQMLSDAPAHSVFVLLSPSAQQESESLPDVLAVVQVALEGQISRKAVEAQLARGHRSAGDLIPWTISQQFGDSTFAQLSGARIVRVAVHPAVQGMGYGSRAIELLYRFYNGEMVNLASEGEESDDGSDESSDEASASEGEDNGDSGGDNAAKGIRGERLKPRKRLPPLLLPLADVKAPRLDWLGTSFGLTNELCRFWTRAGMRMLYLRQTKNDLTGEHSAILVRSLPRRTGYDDAWLPAFVADSRRRIISLLAGSFRDMEVKLATAILDGYDGASNHGTGLGKSKEAKKEIDKRAGSSSGATLSSTELNYIFTPHDLKRLELYGRNLCDHHLVTDLLPPAARIYFTGRFGQNFALSSLQAALLCGIGLQRKTVDSISFELGLPANQVLAMFNKAVRKISIALHRVVEESEKSQLLSGKDLVAAERKADKLKTVTEETLEEDTREGAKAAMALLKGESSSLPSEIAQEAELIQYTIRGSEEQWNKALRKTKEGSTPGKVQIKSSNAFVKRRLVDDDVEKEANAANSKANAANSKKGQKGKVNRKKSASAKKQKKSNG